MISWLRKQLTIYELLNLAIFFLFAHNPVGQFLSVQRSTPTWLSLRRDCLKVHCYPCSFITSLLQQGLIFSSEWPYRTAISTLAFCLYSPNPPRLRNTLHNLSAWSEGFWFRHSKKQNRIFVNMWLLPSGVLESSSQTGQLWNISGQILWWGVLQCPAQGQYSIVDHSFLPVSSTCFATSHLFEGKTV